jgi:hypothetical protein
MDKKSLQLGLNFSTASGRLERQILFKLVQGCGQDSCFRCGKKIERSEDLSIEHKIDWQDVDPALFWDLDNIAFSHRSCNYRAASTGKLKQHRRFAEAPAGQGWCTGHQCYHDEKEFGKCRTQQNGLHYFCRAYRQSIGWQGGKYKSKSLEGLVHGQVRSS